VTRRKLESHRSLTNLPTSSLALTFPLSRRSSTTFCVRDMISFEPEEAAAARCEIPPLDGDVLVAQVLMAEAGDG